MPRHVLPQYIRAKELYEDANRLFKYYIVWYSDSEVISISPKVYAKSH